ncbi:MAG: serine O-acetyltransferase [Methanomassiliicoccales archaeon]
MSWKEDVQTVLERDPAPRSFKEALFFSQGVHAVLIYRISHRMWKKGRVIAARALNYFGRFLTGADIHPGATIGKGFFIDHATGVVIGETAIIGDNVSIFQGVTLGGVSTHRGKRHPTIGNDVVIGANATVLGNIHVGDDVRIGAGSVVVKDVPPNSTVVGVPGKVVKRQGEKRVDLRHDQIPDPVLDALRDVVNNIHELEHRIEFLEKEMKKNQK